jgi:hypothetical protein
VIVRYFPGRVVTGQPIEEVVVPFIWFKVLGDAEPNAVVLLVKLLVDLDLDLCVHKHRVFKFMVQHMAVPVASSHLRCFSVGACWAGGACRAGAACCAAGVATSPPCRLWS